MAASFTAHANPQAARKRFLECFAACGSITMASRWAKIDRGAHYGWLEDPDYRTAFDKASERAVRVLEDEAVRRAHTGVRKAVRYKGKVVGYESEVSDSLLIFLLKGGNRKKFGDRQSLEVTGKDGTPVFPLAALDAVLENPDQ